MATLQPPLPVYMPHNSLNEAQILELPPSNLWAVLFGIRSNDQALLTKE